MAQIKMDDIVEHLDSEIRAALEEAVHQTIDDADFDPHELYRNFVRAVYRKCSTWERVPDQYVRS